MWSPKSWLAIGSPARSLSLDRRLFMVNVVSSLLPKAMPFIPLAPWGIHGHVDWFQNEGAGARANVSCPKAAF